MASQELHIPFRVRDQDGQVKVRVTPVDDPMRVGFSYLPLPFNVARTVGFPVCTATIDYPMRGYASYMGWIQFLLTEPIDGHARREIDLMPMQYGSDWPFIAFGPCPAYFDAPANPDRPDEDWTAHAFLVTCQGVAFERKLSPVLGFRWGYQLRAGGAIPITLKTLPATATRQFQAELTAECPSWTIIGN
jgi:hypothetical protein